MEFAPLFGRIYGSILSRAEVWEIIRAEGPCVHPAKGEALVYRLHRVFYSPVPCGLRPNGPRVRLLDDRYAWD
jgi:hypothetical protein